jgi:hypothetical protein
MSSFLWFLLLNFISVSSAADPGGYNVFFLGLSPNYGAPGETNPLQPALDVLDSQIRETYPLIAQNLTFFTYFYGQPHFTCTDDISSIITSFSQGYLNYTQDFQDGTTEGFTMMALRCKRNEYFLNFFFKCFEVVTWALTHD